MAHVRNHRLLVAIAFLQGIVFYGPVATIYRRVYGLGIEELFLVESISWVVTLLLEAPWGRFADSVGYRRTLILGNVFFLASKIVFSAAYGFSGFLAERLLLALALSALSGCAEAMVYRSAGKVGAEKAFSLWASAGGAGIALASLSAPMLYGVSLRYAAYGTVVPYLAAVIATFFLEDLGEEGRGKEAGQGGRSHLCELGAVAAALMRDGPFVAFLVAQAVLTEASGAATVFLAPLQYERAGIPMAAFGILFALMQGARLASAGAAPLARALGRPLAFRCCLLSAAAGLGALALSASPILSVLGLLSVSLASSAFGPLASVQQNERVIGPNRATALSVYAMIVELASAALNVGVGAVAKIGIAPAFGSLAVALAFLALSPNAVFGRGKPGEAQTSF